MAARRQRKVVSLFGAAVPIPQRQEDVIDKLEWLLRMAKDGAIAGIGYCVVEASGNVKTGWVGNADCHRLCHSADLLHHRMIAAAEE